MRHLRPCLRCVHALRAGTLTRTRRVDAFTLIEIVAVLAIVAALAASVFAAASGVRERQRRERARGELAALAHALEQYRLQYGDYPQTGGFAAAGPDPATPLAGAHAEAKWFNALAGKLGPAAEVLRERTGPAFVGRSWIDLAGRSLETGEYPHSDAEARNALLDPWGRRYQYAYRDAANPARWERPSYRLWSAGPDGRTQHPDATGRMPATDPDNLNGDNLDADEP